MTPIALLLVASTRVVLGGDLCGDLSDAFTQAQAQCPDDAWACPIEIAPGTYDVEAPIHITRRVDVLAYGAELQFHDTHGVVMERSATGATWRGGAIHGATSTATRPLPVGVAIRGGMQTLVDVHVNGFVHGVDIVCQPSGELSDLTDLGFEHIDGHCNLWKLDRVTASANLGSGVYTRGSNANSGVAIGLNAMTNCKAAFDIYGPPNYEEPDEGGKCANVYDQAFLGNTWVAPHSAYAVDTRSTDEHVRYYQYLSHQSNGRTTWIGAYAENGADDGQTGNGPSWLQGYGHQAYGGLNNIRTPRGIRISEWATINQARFHSTDYQGRYSQLILGQGPGLGSVFNLRLMPANLQLRLMPKTEDAWELETQRGSADRLFLLYSGEDRSRWGELQMTRASKLPHCFEFIHAAVATSTTPYGFSVVDLDDGGRAFCR